MAVSLSRSIVSASLVLSDSRIPCRWKPDQAQSILSPSSPGSCRAHLPGVTAVARPDISFRIVLRAKISESKRRGFPAKLRHHNRAQGRTKPACSQSEALPSQFDWNAEAQTELGGPNGGSGGGDDTSNNRWSSGGGGEDEGDIQGRKADALDTVLTVTSAKKLADEMGIKIPADMLQYAQLHGLSENLLQKYFKLQGAAWPLGPAVKTFGYFRDRMLVDSNFLFKVAVEVAIDSGCATFAEVQKRGKDFWKEFDFYLSDLLVGIALDVALVSMLAPAARFSSRPAAAGRLAASVAALPNSMFEAGLAGRNFTVGQRVATLFFKGAQYGVVGFGCGLVGQGFANSLMLAKRQYRKQRGMEEEEELRVPPLFRTAALWGVFMALSSNVRYQVINGLERVVECSPQAKRFPALAMGFTVGVRFGNNIFGGMQFVDWARWSGVQ
eukprot:jgi/Mesen1/3730/ME000203S02817